jgi:hypothetical protein
MRAGDCVWHREVGERWIVAYVRGEHLAWCGWPPGEARVSECDLVKACSDEEHVRALACWANSRGPVEPGDRRREVCAAQLAAFVNSVSALGRNLDTALSLLRECAGPEQADEILTRVHAFLARFPADAAKGGAT